MIVSVASHGLYGLAFAALLLGCVGPAPVPTGRLIELKSESVKIPPTEEELTAIDLATSAIIGDQLAADHALAKLRSLETQRQETGEASTGLIPYAVEARASMEGDDINFRGEARRLLEDADLHVAQRRRLEYELTKDPLQRADQHLDDSILRGIARITNSLVEPIGRSLLSGSLLPMRLIQGLIRVSVEEFHKDELTIDERQALAEWKRFIELHPEDPRALELLARVEKSQRDWYKTQRDRNLRMAQRAIERDEATVAVAYAERTLRYAPEDGEALAIQNAAEKRIAQNKLDRSRSLRAPKTLNRSARANVTHGKNLAVALLGNGDVALESDRLLARFPEGSIEDEIAFIMAISAMESGREDESWTALKRIGELDDLDSNMARHAATLWSSPSQNPYAAFLLARKSERLEQARWLFFGPLKDGARDRDLPRALEWAIEIPTLPQAVTGLPGRLIQFPWARPRRRSPPVFAREYLARYPNGTKSNEIRDWLEDYEFDRKNYVAALRVAETRTDPDILHISKLREKAATQAFTSSSKQKDPALRLAMLRRAVREFPGTEGGHRAGKMLRKEIASATPQHIRVTRAFLYENPEVAGPRGLGIRPEYLDQEKSNGELHQDGLTFIGGLFIDLSFVGKSGRENDPPSLQRRRLSKERLARTVAMIEEAARRTELIDPDYEILPDPDRDLFFERARLGLANYPDQRPEARSGYTFNSPRERYGMVRGREAILPVELVLQGSLEDLGLGAFPRIRNPKKAPDEILYR